MRSAEGIHANRTSRKRARFPADDGLPATRAPVEAYSRVQIVERLVGELFALGCQGVLPRGTRERRPDCHIRQITMYLCRVVLSMRYQHIAQAVGRDRSTVIHGCAAVEDRRDMAAYDVFIDRCEGCVRAVFGAGEGDDHGARS